MPAPDAADQGRHAGLGQFQRWAEPVLAYAAKLAVVKGEDETALLRQGGVLLARFTADAERGGAVPAAIAPARYALAMVLDTRARDNKAIGVQAWAAGAQQYLFDWRNITIGNIREFARIAGDTGPEFAGLRQFLDQSLTLLQGGRQKIDRSRSSSWSGIFAVLLASFALAVVGWAGYVEWRSNRDLARVFAAEVVAIGLDRVSAFPDLAARLDRLEAAAAGVRAEAARAPVHMVARLFGYDAAINAEAAYRAAATAQIPPKLARGIEETLASEGDPLVLYDAIRAWSVLTGHAPWSPEYLSGWAGDRALLRPDLNGLAHHILAMDRPTTALPQPDPELYAQALAFAKEAPEPERAFLELLRSDGAGALPPWQAEAAVPGISQIFLRKSGIDMSQPIAGLYTAAGWTFARDVGAGLAVQTARKAAADLFQSTLPEQNQAPDLVLNALQRRTIDQWSVYLADLRVRPFADTDTAILISGRLSEKHSPIEALLREVWNETGGNDRSRSFQQQQSVAATFADAIRYVDQQGGGKGGSLADISALFASLNVALGAMDRDKATGLQRLMTATDRAQSFVALRHAPPIVEQIVEDVLAQTGQSHADTLTNPLTKAWQTEALDSCKQATEGLFPFAEKGSDADFAKVQQVFAPMGVLDRFFRSRAAPYIDTSVSPWRWKPEASFNGVSQDSAVFFQKAQAITNGLFASRATSGDTFTMGALAERGKAFITLSGLGGPVEASATDLAVAWPGTEPDKGIEVSFQSPDGAAQLTHPGIWGIYHLVQGLRLRERDGGKTFHVDLRSGNARLFLEINFPTAANALSIRGLLGGFACPSVL